MVRILLLLIFTMHFAIATPAQPIIQRCFPDHSPEVLARVRAGNKMCPQEISARTQRRVTAQAALSKFMNLSLTTDQVPDISLVCSGGGYRAALCTLGMLRGLAKIGLLDATLYCSATSGATWTIASWMSHNMNLDDLTAFIKEQVNYTLDFEDLDTIQIIESMVQKLGNGRSVSLNDIWGGILSNVFLSSNTNVDNGNVVRFSDLAPQVAAGLHPMPIFLSAIGNTSPSYQWAEHTPFECGSPYLEAWVPTTAFGKKFDRGASHDPSPEESLGYMLGFCGSAYAINFSDLIQGVKETMQTEHNLSVPTDWLSWLPSGDGTRISPPKVWNFANKVKGCPLSSSSEITFVDGGLVFNIPIPALLRRNVKLHIICDATADALSVANNDMHIVQSYLKKYIYPFPPIDYPSLVTQKISLLTHPTNQQAPIVVYLPNFASFSSFKLSYTTEEFDQVVGGMEEAVVQNAEVFRQAIALALQQITKTRSAKPQEKKQGCVPCQQKRRKDQQNAA